MKLTTILLVALTCVLMYMVVRIEAKDMETLKPMCMEYEYVTRCENLEVVTYITETGIWGFQK